MITEIINQWDKNKDKLERYFKTTPQSEYATYLAIVEKIFEKVLIDKEYKLDRITVIDDGDYQGTQIFIIPEDVYQPCVEDYLITDTYYGSCSGCDTLQSIASYDYEIPTEEQVSQYMLLALHLIQKMKKLSE